MKYIILSTFLTFSTLCISQTPSEFKSRTEIQKRINNIDSQQAYETLSALDRLLKRIDSNLDRKIKATEVPSTQESLSDLEVFECEDKPIEELICEQYRWEIDPELVCYDDQEGDYSIVSQ